MHVLLKYKYTSPQGVAEVRSLTCFLTSNAEHAPIRLVGGSSDSEGRVEVYFNETWGTVCHDNWSGPDAEVVCRQLGLPYGNAQPVGAAVFGQGTGPIWLDYVSCGSSDRSLDECLHSSYPWGRHYCDHGMDAGVVCTNGNGEQLCELDLFNVYYIFL